MERSNVAAAFAVRSLALFTVHGGAVMPILSMTLLIESKLCFENARLVSALRPGNSRRAVRTESESSCLRMGTCLALFTVHGGAVMPILSMTLLIESKLCFENARLVSALRPGNSRRAVRTESESSCLRMGTWWRR
ncbi:hypothetical protein Bbelb_381340 [Branchiostoma belcheri]|nr:hypothetical protein Bbelb_381340 [Branchiostoma belcheri]